MTDKIVSMDGGALPTPAKSSEDCVSLLEQWLELANSGEVVSIAIAGTCGDGTGMYGISRYVEGTSQLVGHLERLKFRLMSDVG